MEGTENACSQNGYTNSDSHDSNVKENSYYSNDVLGMFLKSEQYNDVNNTFENDFIPLKKAKRIAAINDKYISMYDNVSSDVPNNWKRTLSAPNLNIKTEDKMVLDRTEISDFREIALPMCPDNTPDLVHQNKLVTHHDHSLPNLTSIDNDENFKNVEFPPRGCNQTDITNNGNEDLCSRSLAHDVSFSSPEISNIVINTTRPDRWCHRASVSLVDDSPLIKHEDDSSAEYRKTPRLRKKSNTFTKGDTYMQDTRNRTTLKKKSNSLSNLIRRTMSFKDIRKSDNPPCMPNLFKKYKNRKLKKKAKKSNTLPIISEDDLNFEKSSTNESFATIFMSKENDDDDSYLELCLGTPDHNCSYSSVAFPETANYSCSRQSISSNGTPQPLNIVLNRPRLMKRSTSCIDAKSIPKHLLKQLTTEDSCASLDQRTLQRARDLLNQSIGAKKDDQEHVSTPPKKQKHKYSLSLLTGKKKPTLNQVEEDCEKNLMVSNDSLKHSMGSESSGIMFLPLKNADVTAEKEEELANSDNNKTEQNEAVANGKAENESSENVSTEKQSLWKKAFNKLSIDYKLKAKIRGRNKHYSEPGFQSSTEDHASSIDDDQQQKKIMKRFLRRYSFDMEALHEDMDECQKRTDSTSTEYKNILYRSIQNIQNIGSKELLENEKLEKEGDNGNESTIKDSKLPSPPEEKDDENLNYTEEQLEKLRMDHKHNDDETCVQKKRYKVFVFPYNEGSSSKLDNVTIDEENLKHECRDEDFGAKSKIVSTDYKTKSECSKVAEDYEKDILNYHLTNSEELQPREGSGCSKVAKEYEKDILNYHLKISEELQPREGSECSKVAEEYEKDILNYQLKISEELKPREASECSKVAQEYEKDILNYHLTNSEELQPQEDSECSQVAKEYEKGMVKYYLKNSEQLQRNDTECSKITKEYEQDILKYYLVYSEELQPQEDSKCSKIAKEYEQYILKYYRTNSEELQPRNRKFMTGDKFNGDSAALGSKRDTEIINDVEINLKKLTEVYMNEVNNNLKSVQENLIRNCVPCDEESHDLTDDEVINNQREKEFYRNYDQLQNISSSNDDIQALAAQYEKELWSQIFVISKENQLLPKDVNIIPNIKEKMANATCYLDMKNDHDLIQLAEASLRKRLNSKSIQDDDKNVINKPHDAFDIHSRDSNGDNKIDTLTSNINLYMEGLNSNGKTTSKYTPETVDGKSSPKVDVSLNEQLQSKYSTRSNEDPIHMNSYIFQPLRLALLAANSCFVARKNLDMKENMDMTESITNFISNMPIIFSNAGETKEKENNENNKFNLNNQPIHQHLQIDQQRESFTNSFTLPEESYKSEYHTILGNSSQNSPNETSKSALPSTNSKYFPYKSDENNVDFAKISEEKRKPETSLQCPIVIDDSTSKSSILLTNSRHFPYENNKNNAKDSAKISKDKRKSRPSLKGSIVIDHSSKNTLSPEPNTQENGKQRVNKIVRSPLTNRKFFISSVHDNHSLQPETDFFIMSGSNLKSDESYPEFLRTKSESTSGSQTSLENPFMNNFETSPNTKITAKTSDKESKGNIKVQKQLMLNHDCPVKIEVSNSDNDSKENIKVQEQVLLNHDCPGKTEISSSDRKSDKESKKNIKVQEQFLLNHDCPGKTEISSSDRKSDKESKENIKVQEQVLLNHDCSEKTGISNSDRKSDKESKENIKVQEQLLSNHDCPGKTEMSNSTVILDLHKKTAVSPKISIRTRTWSERQDGGQESSLTWLQEKKRLNYKEDVRGTPAPSSPSEVVINSVRSPPAPCFEEKEVSMKKCDTTQKDRCIEVYPETLRQRQRNTVQSPSKVTIKNWEIYSASNDEGKKLLPSVKALRNQFEMGKTASEPTTPSKAPMSLNSSPVSSIGTSSAPSSLTSPPSSITSTITKDLPNTPGEPVEPIFHQFKPIDEELKELMSKSLSTQGWNPHNLLNALYYVPDAPKIYGRRTPPVSIEGYMEKLPSGRKKATFWNAWKRRYFVAKDGVLYCYPNDQTEKASVKLSLVGGKIEVMDASVVNDDDGERDTRSVGMLGVDDGKGHYLVLRCVSKQEAERWKIALETHTVDDFCSQYVQPWPRPSNPTLLRDTLVIDIGSCSVRAGVLASQPTLPQLFFPSVVATHRETKNQVWGIEALMPDVRSTSTISFPIRPSHKISKFSVDLHAFSSLLQKTFTSLKVDPKNYNIQLSVPRILNPDTQKELLQIMFNKFNVKSVNMTHQSILALYAYNSTSGVVVDIGERLDVVPVIDGYIVDGGVSRVPYGGCQIMDHLRQFLFEKNISLINEVDSYVIRQVLETICYCAEHYNTEKQRCTMDTKKYLKSVCLEEYFPDIAQFRDISLDFGRFQTTEGLFNPDAWGLDHQGLHKLVNKAIQECSMDIRKEMSRSIFLAGGVTQLPGLMERLTNELDNLTPPAIKPKVHASPYRYHAAFLGACQLAESSSFHQSKITKEEWVKQGISTLRKWSH